MIMYRIEPSFFRVIKAHMPLGVRDGRYMTPDNQIHQIILSDYIYIYVCVCVCVCVINMSREYLFRVGFIYV